ncbi:MULTISPECIES: DMT family transporter [unclassified Caballeronia]|uniref:DMT family transporter n=1 Tax=unclassified Caballeronia TaxID=2646786 RepID=UPI002866DF53|nr:MULTISPECIES: DMT family transporter [unclassified Caballeronia]MDR5777738.1 DMT family transporter [Caballeronia sp. LZ002]MDR5798505.1 DMT family transporter [Caballeronia sp. LZ001]MDR5804978.1 DMT family transporter [Caballeronia sp. LZ001]MDR5853168.1 DMT family transporter [Caballeronia sp. LZ003]
MYCQLISVLLNALSVLLAKLALNQVSENAFLAIYALTFISLALMYARVSELAQYLCSRNGLASALFNSLGTWCFYKGLEKLTPGTHSFVARSYIIFGTLISVLWFREKLTTTKLFVLLACITGVVLSSLPAAAGSVTFEAVMLTLLSSLLFALNYAVLKKKPTDIHPCVPLGTNGFCLLILLGCLSVSQKGWPFSEIAIHGIIYIVLSAAFIFYSMFAYIKSAGTIDFHVATALRALSPVVVTLISLPFFGYSGSPIQMNGEVLIVVSIVAMGITQKMNTGRSVK